MRRLYSTFAAGVPGAGLLLLRLVSGSSIIVHASLHLRSESPLLSVVEIALGILLVAGLWTPIAGSVTAALGVWNTLFQPGGGWACFFLGTIGAALALLGPGAWSLDARLFGWKRIEIRRRKG